MRTEPASPRPNRHELLARARRIVHLTLQPPEHDARVHRAVSALRAGGREIVLVAPGHGFERKPMGVARKLASGVGFGTGARLGLAGTRAAFWAFSDHRSALRALMAATPDAIHAHDWDGLVIGARAARKLGVPLVYDAHEFAPEMHVERRLWRWAMTPAITRLEADAIRVAEAVIVVSPGLAEVMRQVYGLEQRPVLVRNVPDLAPAAHLPRPEREDRILVHYHGILAEGRGLLTLVEAIALTSPRFRLRLTGPWRQARFKRTLIETIARLELTERVEIDPPVPFDQLVTHASEADIGVSLLSADSRHNRYSLPNKVFEYLHASLCLLSASHSENIAELIRKHGCGVTLRECTPEAIAGALEAMDRGFIDERRAAASVAAETVSWRNEARRLLAIYGVDAEPTRVAGR